MKVSVLSLVFLPLTFGYAIFRYRLMDVDLIFKRGMAYTIAAGRSRRRTSRWLASHPSCSTRTSRTSDQSGLVVAIVVTASALRPVQELDAGAHGQVLLSEALRLSPDADRIRTRPEL